MLSRIPLQPGLRVTAAVAGTISGRTSLSSSILVLRRLQSLQQRRTLIAAPKPGDGPLLERRADRELPTIQTRSTLRRSLPIFLALVAAASLAIFNYQKLSSPVVAGTLYALRTSPQAREYLGDEIYFAAQIPWIGGGMNQVQGKIDVHFSVRGTKNTGVMRFVSHRPTPRGVFETTEWSLQTSDGRRIDLLEEGDPFRALRGLDDADADALEEGEGEGQRGTRGYRQMSK